MTKREVYHVVPWRDSWAVKLERVPEPLSVHSTQSLAIASAVTLAKAATLGQVKIHGKDGKIRAERTYVADPYPPEG